MIKVNTTEIEINKTNITVPNNISTFFPFFFLYGVPAVVAESAVSIYLSGVVKSSLFNFGLSGLSDISLSPG